MTFEELSGSAVVAALSDNALVVLKKRYLLKDSFGEIVEEPDEMFRRVADALAEPERLYSASDDEVASIADRFYRSMASLEFLPNSPTLMNAGTGAGTLSACFVLPLTDSMEGIMGAARNAAMVQKYGGGTGFSLSEIRRKGAPIKTTHGKACGPIAVLRLLSAVSTLVTQGGKRDGANMAVMDVHHPDILEFIDCKAREGTIHNFNISVGASDEFMKAVKEGKSYALREPEDFTDMTSPQVEVDRLDAREVFDKIVHGAWRNGEPGMIFLDTVNFENPVRHIGKITATNPCGEQPLLPNESCNLGSINVGKFVTENETFNWDKLADIVHLTIRFLDNVIDANKYAVKDIEKLTKGTRKLGLGVMGFADMLIRLGIPYDSDEGVAMGKRLMRFIKNESDKASMALGKERGPFSEWPGSPLEKKGNPLRNACRLTVAPTGTISMIAGASSGIEPLFSIAYRKQNILEGQTLMYVNEAFEAIARKRGFYSEELMTYLAEGGSLQERNDVPEDVRALFKVSADITPKWHVLMQAAFQESTDAGISKTINFPNQATQEDVYEAYMLAWETKCKGITVYRAGSREKEVLTAGHDSTTQKSSEPIQASDSASTYYALPRHRPAELIGVTRRIRTGRGNVYVTVNKASDGRPFEVFAAHGKAGGNDSAMAEALSRTISLALRSGVDPQEVVRQLRGITDTPIWDNGILIRSVPDAIATVLDILEHREVDKPLEDSESVQHRMFPTPSSSESAPLASLYILNEELCPECSTMLAHEEGCVKCYSCGYSRC